MSPLRSEFATISKAGYANLEDGTEVQLRPGQDTHPGDIGMAEWDGAGWTWVLFEAAAPVEHLRCQEGHDWTRPPAPGRKPTHCPEHRAKRTPARMKGEGKDRVPVEHGVPRVPSQSLTEAQEAPPEPKRTSRVQVTEPPPVRSIRVELSEDDVDEDGNPLVVRPSRISLDEIEERYHPDKETMLKLAYIDEQLSRKRSADDNKALTRTQELILSSLSRRHA